MNIYIYPLNCEHQTSLKPPSSLHWPEELSTMGQNSGTLGILKYPEISG